MPQGRGCGVDRQPIPLGTLDAIRGASTDNALTGDRSETRHLVGWTFEHQCQGQSQRYRAVELAWSGLGVGGADGEELHWTFSRISQWLHCSSAGNAVSLACG